MKIENRFTEYENTKKEGAEPMDRSFEEWKKRMEEFRKFHCEGERLGYDSCVPCTYYSRWGCWHPEHPGKPNEWNNKKAQRQSR